MLLIPTGKIDKVSIKSDKRVEPTETINLSSLITKQLIDSCSKFY